jgi:hypothetical protein
MRTRLMGVLFVAIGAVGCASAPHGVARTYQEGDARGQPSVEALPSLDVDDSELTAEMRMARMLSAESLSLIAPSRPIDNSTTVMSAWSDHELKNWVRQKNARAEAARKELDRAAVQNHRQRIMAGAMVGLVYEDLARALLAIPVPAELASEPEIAAMYLDLMKRQAAPYLMQSSQAYNACAGNADQLPTLGHWGHFCTERQGLLPRSGDSLEQRGASTTQVSVVRR